MLGRLRTHVIAVCVPKQSLAAQGIHRDVDRRSGIAVAHVRSGAAKGVHEFQPPSQGEKNDWVLVLDDAERELPTESNK